MGAMLVSLSKMGSKMKTKIALSLLTAALLPACTTTHSASNNNSQTGRYANTEAAPPAEGTTDIPAEGPADVRTNPAYVPTPVLRDAAASHP
jgi:hypothetical protein